MSLAAPNKGIFAFAIVFSFCLHTVAFVLGAQKYAQNTHNDIAKTAAISLAKDAAMPLSIGAIVDMGVVAKRYDYAQISFIGIYDNNKNLLSALGDEMDAQAHTIQNQSTYTHAVADDNGFVTVLPKSVSRAQIISAHWLFLVACMALHALIWFLYAYLARPSKKMVVKIEQMVQQKLNAQARHQQSNQNKAQSQKPQSVSDFLANQQPNLHNTHPIDEDADVVLLVEFLDNMRLLPLLSDDVATPYFELYNEILQKSCEVMLSSNRFKQVQLVKITPFATKTHNQSTNSASITLKGKDSIVLAAILGKILVDISQIVYERHRQIKQFALPIKTIACTKDKLTGAQILFRQHSQSVMILAHSTDYPKIGTLAKLERFNKPTSIHEQNCRWITAIQENSVDSIQKLAQKVLQGA